MNQLYLEVNPNVLQDPSHFCNMQKLMNDYFSNIFEARFYIAQDDLKLDSGWGRLGTSDPPIFTS